MPGCYFLNGHVQVVAVEFFLRRQWQFGCRSSLKRAGAGVSMGAEKHHRKGKGWRRNSRVVLFALLSVICFSLMSHGLGACNFKPLHMLDVSTSWAAQDRLFDSILPSHGLRTAGGTFKAVHSATILVLDFSVASPSLARLMESIEARSRASMFVDSPIKVRAPPQSSFLKCCF